MGKTCLDEEAIADYLEDRLSHDQRMEVEKHLSDCEMCLNAFVIANDLIRGKAQLELDMVPAEVTEAAVRLLESKRPVSSVSISEVLGSSLKDLYGKVTDFLRLKPWVDWQLQPIRGPKPILIKDLIILKKKFQDIETEIEIEKTGENQTNIRVKFPEPIVVRQGIRVTLEKGQTEIASYMADSDQVLFENIPFGRYGLTFVREGKRLGRFFFETKETAHGRR
jgi:hypothetical protein